MLLKTLKRVLLIRVVKQQPQMRTLYDERCLQVYETKSLGYFRLNPSIFIDPGHPVVPVDLKNMSKHDVRMRLEYYDSHVARGHLRYEQSSTPTVLLLPNSESRLDEFKLLIASLVENNFRVLAFRFPGFGQSKILEENIYECTITQRVCIVQDFLYSLIPYRKIPLNSVIGFGDSSHLIPFLCQIYGDCIHFSSNVLVNPAPPKYLSGLKESVFDSYLAKHSLTKQIYKNKILKKLKSVPAKSQDELFLLYLSYKEINEELIERASIHLTTNLKTTQIFLNPNDKIYDCQINNYFRKYFGETFSIYVLEELNSSIGDNELTRIQHFIAQKCVDLIKQTTLFK